MISVHTGIGVIAGLFIKFYLLNSMSLWLLSKDAFSYVAFTIWI